VRIVDLGMRDVVIANVAKQHAWQAAEAADRAEVLRTFVTCTAFRRGDPVARWLARRHPTTRTGKRVQGRLLEIGSSARLIRYPELELVEWTLGWLPARMRQDLHFLKCEVFDRLAASSARDCRIFHGFEQCAAVSMRAARAAGATALLDQSIVAWPTYSRRRIECCDAFGVSVRPETSHAFAVHVERKARERETADYFLAGLDEVRRSLVAAGVSQDRIFVLPYGADLARFQAPVERPCREPFHLMFVGARNWVKGLPFLLRALELLQDRRIHLTIYGAADPEWSATIARLIASIHHSGAGTVRSMGIVPQADIVAAFRTADAFVFPSLIGGIGLAALQAMAAGLPLVVSDPDVMLAAGSDCLVADPRRPEAIAEAIARLRDSCDLRFRLGAAAQRSARRFSWDAYGAGLASAYRLIRERAPGRVLLPPGAPVD
jgi:glycosyltransferase involved in cell wall biosynthesis